jgi:hypothetical protein
MSNHKCNLDWMYLWSAAIRTGSLWHVVGLCTLNQVDP